MLFIKSKNNKPDMDIKLPIHLFTVEEYHRLAENGILHEDDRVEFLEGRIVDMTPIGSKHASCVGRLTSMFFEKIQKRAIVQVQNPVILHEQSEPQPDIMLLKYRDDFYAERHPGPKDILLLIEVTDSSLEYEKKVKIPLYAKADILEVWLVNLVEKTLEVYRSPIQDGYEIVTKLFHTQSVSPQKFPDINLKVADILGISQ